jgi:hypothetical protein
MKSRQSNYQRPGQKRRRDVRGAGIIYGTFATMAILLGSVFGTVLVLNIGYCTIYDEKLARVNAYVSQYAAAHAQNGTGEGAIESYAQTVIAAMGLTPSNVSIQVAHTSTSVQVTVANQFSLFGSRGLLPSNVTMRQTAVAAVGVND